MSRLSKMSDRERDLYLEQFAPKPRQPDEDGEQAQAARRAALHAATEDEGER